MNPFTFPDQFHALHAKATALYAEGRRGPETYFTSEELAFLAANGITAQHLYDYAEDLNNYAAPSANLALAIELVRRDYFLNVQRGRSSGQVLDVASLPPKTEQVRGVEWLPRLLPKARAKLRGELPATIMFCCGGDRKFFQDHKVLPSEFLSMLWRESDDAAVVDWVLQRSAS